MGNVNIPSYNALLPKERRIRSIQELYEAVKELQTGGSSELSARVEALESLVSEGDNPTLIIDKFNEILDFLDGYDNTDSLVDLLAGKQDVIDSSHKMSADLVDDTNTSNKFTNATEKQTWNGKQDALTFNTTPSSSNKVATMADVPTTMGASGSGHKGGLVPDTPSTAGTTKFLREDGTWAEVDMSGKEDITAIEAPVNQSDATAPITSLSTQVGKYYRIEVPVETLAVTLPAMTDSTVGKAVVLFLTGGTAPAVTITSTAPSGGTAPAVHLADGFEIKAGETNEVNCYWNGLAWIVASVKIVISNS